jgi:site-specific DNA-methyltransferase (adenine-specific)
LDPPDISRVKCGEPSTDPSTQEGNREYLRFIARVCQHSQRILKKTGVLFFHSQPISVFSLRLILNQIFGEAQFRDEFVWQPERISGNAKSLGRQHDTILFYAKTSCSTQNRIFRELTKDEVRRHTRLADERGSFSLTDLTVPSFRPSLQFEWRGILPSEGRS